MRAREGLDATFDPEAGGNITSTKDMVSEATMTAVSGVKTQADGTLCVAEMAARAPGIEGIQRSVITKAAHSATIDNAAAPKYPRELGTATYGLGLSKFHYRGHQVVWHGGGQPSD